MDRHPTTAHWSLPAADRPPPPAPLRRTNLRELAARPQRFEHHLVVVARAGDAQLELATASEPLYFAHRNQSDEYAVPLATGDAMADAFPFRTFLSEFASGADVARINHKIEQLLLHPWGLLHWPGKLKPPWAPMAMPPGMRRCGLSAVLCGTRPLAPAERPLFVSEGNDGACKSYGGEVPFLLADLRREPSRLVAMIGDADLELLVAPARIAPRHGGYLLVLDGEAPWFAGDLVWIPAGAAADGAGIGRALLLDADHDAPPPPPSWAQAPAPPFAPYEEAPAEALPVDVGDLVIEPLSAELARVRLGRSQADVPRYWLARLLFRAALHDFRLGWIETYGGFTCDDSGVDVRIGLRGGGAVTVARARAAAVFERLYRAVAPPGYVERLT
jgi:hypothetical protein